MLNLDKNLKNFLIKFIIFIVLLFLIRAVFQTPVEYFRLKMFYEQDVNRVVSKGDLMKVIALMGVLFIVYLREQISKIEHQKINYKESIIYFLISITSVACYYGLRYITNYYKIDYGAQLYTIIIGKTLFLAISFFSLLVSVFQKKYAQTFFNNLKKEILIAGILTIIFYFLLMYFQSQWTFFSEIVMKFLVAMFSPFYKVSIKETLLTVDNFSISIGAPCSGIESLMLFFSLFAIILAMDYKKIKLLPFVLLFILGFIGTFAVNNLRLFLLVLIGLKIDPKLAVGLFHTHAGWILFIFYFIVYFALIRKFIYKKDKK